jgi:hypothetical protein
MFESSFRILIMWSLPIDFRTIFTNEESMKYIQSVIRNGRCINRRSKLCHVLTVISSTRSKASAFEIFRHWISTWLAQKFSHLLGYEQIGIFDSNHIQLIREYKLVTIANNASTKHILTLDIDFEVVHNFLQGFMLVITLFHQICKSEFCVFLILIEWT